MEIDSCIPPGFRFHPTEEELVGYYLTKKINCHRIDLDVIVDIDLYRIEPWEIQEKCKMGYDEQREWYFFSHKDKKYPTGTRTNRATGAGFWKATGRDKAVLSSNQIIGMRKTLVFYKGRAPNGRKSDWIMHEYRLQTSEHAPPHEEGWVVCRAFKKPTPNHRQGFQAWAHAHYIHNNNNRHNINSIPGGVTIFPTHSFPDNTMASPILNQQNLQPNNNSEGTQEPMIEELPKLDSPTGYIKEDCVCEEERNNHGGDYIDWKNMDDLIASQPISSLFYELDSQNQYGAHSQAQYKGWVPDF